MDTVTIRKIKLKGVVYTWRAYVIAADDHGTWLFTPRGSQVHNTEDSHAPLTVMGNGTEPGFLWLMPRNEWWFAAWWRRAERIHATYIDACTPSTLVDGAWTWTDLELDVCRNELDRTVWIADEDEFEDSIAAGWIDAESQRTARAVADDMVRRLTDRDAPFDDLGWRRLDEALARGLPALEHG